ncbi:type II toxin-antitoxin system prevent-host-death family antitoxin [candidate division KSB1 bacterium]|nr:type II toxin-antitoxin system prevent-host-death family antitoxin [candidate division KSB1 bacterium]
MKATAKDLRFYSKEILETVSRGEEVVITYRGKPHAKLVPITTTSDQSPVRNHLFGMWKDHELVDDVDQFVREKRKGRFNVI